MKPPQLDFERLDAAWPRGRTAERAEIGRQREDPLSGILARDRIVTARAETLADAAVQLRRLVVMAEETPRPRALLSSPDVRGHWPCSGGAFLVPESGLRTQAELLLGKPTLIQRLLKPNVPIQRTAICI